MEAKEVRDSALRKRFLQDHPSELQERLMSALLKAQKPLSSPDLGRKVGLQTNVVRGYCDWLLNNGYVDRKMRKVIRVVAGNTAKKPVTFWSLLAKGEEYLSGKAAAHDSPGIGREAMP